MPTIYDLQGKLLGEAITAQLTADRSTWVILIAKPDGTFTHQRMEHARHAPLDSVEPSLPDVLPAPQISTSVESAQGAPFSANGRTEIEEEQERAFHAKRAADDAAKKSRK